VSWSGSLEALGNDKERIEISNSYPAEERQFLVNVDRHRAASK
jgi:hypothetical protein